MAVTSRVSLSYRAVYGQARLFLFGHWFGLLAPVAYAVSMFAATFSYTLVNAKGARYVAIGNLCLHLHTCFKPIKPTMYQVKKYGIASQMQIHTMTDKICECHSGLDIKFVDVAEIQIMKSMQGSIYR